MRIENVRHGFFFLLLALVTLAFVGLIWEFLESMFWAAVLAILFHRLQGKMTALFGGRSSLAAVATIAVIVVMVILPLLLVGAAVTREAISVYTRISSGELEIFPQLIRFVDRTLPTVAAYLQKYGVNPEELQKRLSSGALLTGRFFAAQAVHIGQNALRTGVLFVLMVYILFFFLRDGDRLREILIRALPLGNARERRLLAKFAEVSRATIKGVVVVAIIQGGLGGILFWLVGISAPVFWGAIMTIFSLLPAVGTGIIWVPAGAVLILTGEVFRGIVVLAAGSLVLGLVDNVLRPILVGRDTQMPDFLVLLSTIGGLTVFGISGFVIGPVIAALFLSIWQMFEQEYAMEGAAEPQVSEEKDRDEVSGA